MAKGSKYLSELKVFASYGKGWRLVLDQFLPLISIIIVLVLLEVAVQLLGEVQIGGLLVLLATFLLVLPIRWGVQWVFLQAAREKPFSFNDMFVGLRGKYWQLVLAAILTAAFTIIGFILLIVPGFIVLSKLAFVPFLMIDRKLDALEAIKASWDMTTGHAWTIFGMILLAIPIIIGGLIVLGVGVLFSIAWITATLAVYYYSYESQKPAKRASKKAAKE